MPQETLELGSEVLSYTLRRSRRAKRLLLHVDISGVVELVVPWHASYAEARRFLQEKQTWIVKQQAIQATRQAQLPKRELASGAEIPCFGRIFTLNIGSGSRSHVRVNENMLVVTTSDQSRVRSLVEAWYRRQARLFFTQEAHELASHLGIHSLKVRITGARTLWGSCNSRRRSLSFTWRLALAPAEVARYVAAHEVAHLRYAGHGKRFWQLVEKLHPNAAEHRNFLRTQGHTLEL